MEAGESKQSGITSADQGDFTNPLRHAPGLPLHRSPRESQTPITFRDSQNMAAATLISPSPYPGPHSFPPPPPPPSSSYQSHRTPGSNIVGLMSPVEPHRRASDESDGPPRQSLPSISEVIRQFPSGVVPATAPGSTYSSFASTPHTFSAEPRHDPHSPPRPLHPPPSSTFPPREEAHMVYAESPRPPFGSIEPGARSLPTFSSFTSPHPSPPINNETEIKHHEHLLNGAHHPHPHPPPPVQPETSLYPPGQMPLPPAFSSSPRYNTHMSNPTFAGRPSYPRDEADFRSRPSLETFCNYQQKLTMVANAARTIYNFAEAYSNIAQEQQSPHPIPGRLPPERELNDMLSNTEMLRESLIFLRDYVENSIAIQTRDTGTEKMQYDDGDGPMYHGINNTFYPPEVKKRRGRAAPPGRCHSCNRIDTPEWRRGPDGARTLCNACGLHYAKLERKRQMETRNTRQKPADDGN